MKTNNFWVAATFVLLFYPISSGCDSDPNEGAEEEIDRVAIFCPFETTCAGVAAEVCVGSWSRDDWLELPESKKMARTQAADCVSNATSCAEYRDCYEAQCTNSTCDGDVLLGCERGGVTREDCAELGGTCSSTEGLGARCTSLTERCEGRVFLPCEGITQLRCPHEQQHLPNLSRCSEDKTCGEVFCVDIDQVAGCDQTHCSEDGSQIVYCLAGESITFDCREQGPRFTCRDDGGEVECAPPQVERCTSSRFASSCDGDVVVQCAYGGEFLIDCAKAGGTCVVDGDQATCRAN